MAESVGQIGLDLVVNKNQFEKQMSGIQGMAKKAGAALAAAFGVKKLVDFGKQCVELGSNLAEVQNVVDVTFPKMTAQVDRFAKDAAASFGLSETMAKKFTGTFGAMAKAFGFSEKQAYDMSTTLTGLAGDVASFYNISQDEAYTKLKSVFTGETETLKDLGVVMTQNALDAYAMANGWGRTTQAMTEAEKVALRYAFVQDQLSAASGDFIRTSDGWANQVRVLKLNFDSLKATLGQGLINVLTPVLKVLNSLLAKLMTLASAFKSFTELITGNKAQGGSGFKNTAGELTDVAGAADNMADSTSAIGDAAESTAKKLNLMNFDKIQKVESPKSVKSSGIPNIDTSGSFGNLAEGETEIEKIDKKFQKMFSNIKNNVQPTIDSLKRLWDEGLSKLGAFNNKALKDFYHNVLVPIGSWTFGTGLPRFIDALNGGIMNIDFRKINTALNNLWKAITPFAINIGEGLLWFWENVLVPLGTWTANEIVPRFLNTLAIAIEALNRILEALKPLFKWFWDSVLQPIMNWSGGLFLTIWDGINNALKKFGDWCSEHPVAVQNMAIIVGSFFAAFKITSFVNGIVDMIAKMGGLIGIVSKLGKLITSVLNPWTLAIGAAIAIGVLLWKNWDTISEKAKEVWDFVKNKFQEFSNFLTSVFQKDWTKNFGALGNVLNGFSRNVSNIFNSVKTIFNGLINFISGIFSGNWKKAWNGVKDIFKGIWDLMVSVVKSPINMIIGAINGLISGIVSGLNTVIGAMNRLHFKIPEWVPKFGGKSFGFDISRISAPRIPYLAQGGYVKANTPQLAMIGDNRHYGEIVAPEDKMQEMVNAAVKAASGSGVSKAELQSLIDSATMRIISALASMGFYIDGEELAKAILKAIDRLDGRYNPVKVY